MLAKIEQYKRRHLELGHRVLKVGILTHHDLVMWTRPILLAVFIRPFEKRTYYAVAMWQDKFLKFGTQVACCILLDISSVFCKKNIIFRILAIIFARFRFFEVFRAFFLHVLRYQFETWYIHALGGVTRQVRVSFQLGHFDLLYSQK